MLNCGCECFFFIFSEGGLPEKPKQKATNSSLSLAEYLTSKYDKTVRPNCDSGEKCGEFKEELQF